MHYIQKHILDELRTVESMRYAQLNSDGIESGHFRYHLGQLVNDGYVAQLERGLYGLTATGQTYVDKLSEHRVNAMPMPKVITYTLLTAGTKVMLQKKTKQPYMDLLNMIGGKLHEGETAQAAAIREVYEKTGQTIATPTLAGVFEIMIYANKQLLTHAVAYVHTAEVAVADYDELIALNVSDLDTAANLAPDFLPIFTNIQTRTGTCIETLELHIND